MEHKIELKVNGKAHKAEIKARVLLVDFLRDYLDLTGTNIGCDTSQCGACTILMDGQTIKSCTAFAVQANGTEITTIEGIAKNGELHPLQQAFWDEHGLQCGYCTSGMIMAGIGVLEKNPNPTESEIRHSLEGNICRCTGYQNIIAAVKEAASKM